MKKKISVKPIINRANNQMNFSIKKSSIPKKYKEKLPKLKSIKLNIEDFEWD